MPRSGHSVAALPARRWLNKAPRGFTLIELMVVVAIVAILAAIAIPLYQEYTIRGRVTEGLGLADAMKPTIVENISSGNANLMANPCTGVEGLSAGTRNTRSITCTGAGVLTLTMALTSSSTFNIILTPDFRQRGNRFGQVGDNRVTWTCQTDADYFKYVPAECRNGLVGNAS